MAAANYWRVMGLSAWGEGVLELSAFQLHDATGRVDASAVLTSIFPPATGTLAALQDSDLTTAASWADIDVRAASFSLIWTFATAVDIVALYIGSADSPSTFLEEFTLQRSDDGLTWSNVGSGDLGGGSGLIYPGARALTRRISADVVISTTVYAAHFSGTNGAQPPTDEKGNSNIYYGDCRLVAGGSIVGSGSSALYVPGGAAAGVTVPISSEDHPLNLTTGDWTIETEFYLVDQSATKYTVFNWGGGYLYSWPNIRLHMVGETGMSVALRSASAGDGAPDIANFVPTYSIFPGRGYWTHLALTREGSVFRLWVNGVKCYEVSSALALHSSNNLAGMGIGNAGYDVRYAPAPSDGVEAYFRNFRVLRSCLYTADFTPSTSPDFGTVFSGALLRTSQSHVETVRDMEFGGPGRVYGTVKEFASPTNLPLRRKVLLMDEASRLVIRQTWSDAVTGAYEFRNMRDDLDYTVLAYDYTGLYRAVVADAQRAEVAAS